MKYENPEIATLSKARLKNYSAPISLLKAILYGWFSFVFLCTSMPFMNALFEDYLPEVVVYYQSLLSLGLAFGLACISIYHTYIYNSRPPPTSLDEEQLRLLGLDPSKIPHSPKEQFRSPVSPSGPTRYFGSPSSPVTDILRAGSPEAPSDWRSQYYRNYSPAADNMLARSPSPSSSSSMHGDGYYSPSRTGGSSPYASPATSFRGIERSLEDAAEGARRRRESLLSPEKLASMSPPRSIGISDARSLDSYLVEVDKQAEFKLRHAPGSPSGPITQDNIYGATPSQLNSLQNFPKYQTMKPELVTSQTNTSAENTNIIKANELYKRLKVTPFLDSWSDRTRLWLAGFVLHPCLAWINKMEADIGKDALYQSNLSSVSHNVQNFSKQQQTMFSVSPLQAQGFNNTGPQQQKVMEQRIRLDKWFGEFGGSREYVVERIRVLAQSSCLQNFAWNGGGDFKQKKWTTELPTDSQIVMHLFCCHMDEQIFPTDPQHQLDTFTAKHFVKLNGKAVSNIAIVQASLAPPHHDLIVDGEEWTVLKGRDNVFHAISLFVVYIQRSSHGFFHSVSLGSPSIGLLDVISDD